MIQNPISQKRRSIWILPARAVIIYDNENQLLTADTPNVDYTYTYDQRNNRLTQRIVTTSPASDVTDYYTYNKEDELTAWERRNTQTQAVLESYTFSYDEMGYCISQTKTSVTPNETTAYEYYVGGNLKQVTLPDASEIAFTYDAEGNRIQKTNATEIITYHYAGSELKSEVHQNKQNQNILYTLTYYPYGFEKTVGQTTTAYYYIYDNRGHVWALTDDSGDILETYDYSPYGELLSTPSITNHLFLSGADQCIYDEETSLVHLNNRYYIPKLGRFLQRDSVEGSPTSPISQNLYTYCQNSPITLIDPSGNSPQNTGTPPRTETANIANFGSDMSCYVPDIIRPVVAISMNLEAIPIDYDAMTAKPQSAFETFDSCRVMVGDHCGSELVTIDGVVYKVEYGIDINGIPIVVVTNNKTGERATEIENAMNVALEELFYDGFFKNGNGGELSVSDIFDNMVKLRDMIREINKFSQENSSKWGDITGRASGYKGEFMYNATRGAAIADGMKKDDETIFYVGNHDKGQYDMEIGFWTSYWARQKGMNVGYYTTGRGDGEDILGLLDMALIMKALMYKENGTLDPNRTNINTYDDGSYHSTDYGLTMVNGLYFDEHQEKMTSVNFRKGDLWKTDPFYNIGCGMGILYLKAGQGHTLNDWIDNIEKYNPGDRRGGEVLWYFQKMKQKYYPNVKWPYKQPKKPLPPPYYVPGPGDPVRQP